MKKLEWPMLDWEIFNPPKFAYGDNSLYFLYGIVIVIGILIAGGIGSGVFALASLVLPDAIASVLFFLPALLVMLAPFGQQFYVLGGMDEGGRGYNRNRLNSKSLMQEYLKLSKEDRALFPPNIIKRLHQDMTTSDRKTVNLSVRRVLDEIYDRNRARTQLERKLVPVDDILDELDRAHKHVEIETETMRELG